ncbi:MAG: BACON domain-containing carbohydrate-binding protein [Bryobacteraceae bacterium]
MIALLGAGLGGATLAAAPPKELSTADWSAIRAEYERHRHGAVAEIGGGYKMRSPGQQWMTRFDRRGFSVQPENGAPGVWRWGLELESYGFPGQMVKASEAPPESDVNRIRYRRSGDLEEWFLNDGRGLEQGFTVLRRPAGEGLLAFDLAVRGGLEPRLEDGAVGFVDRDGAQVVRYSGLRAWDAEGKALPARFALAGGRVRIMVEERGAAYPVTVDPVAQGAYLKASNTGGGDDFGTSVAVSGDTVVIGAPLEDSNATGVNGDQTNNSLNSAGAAYVFVRNHGLWSQQAYLKASNTGANDWFGSSVAVSGDTVVVGAWREESNAIGVGGNEADNSASSAGAAYVFVRTGGTWSQRAYLKASNGQEGDQFGWSVAVSGGAVVVGAPYEDRSSTGTTGDFGAAYFFLPNSFSSWTQFGYLQASNPAENDHFGWSVAVSGDTVAVGAPGGSGGAAYVFARLDFEIAAGVSQVLWNEPALLKAPNPEAGADFGWSVAASGETVVVGEPNRKIGNSPAGSAYLFARKNGTWGLEANLKADHVDPGDEFGWSVAVSGDAVLAGARGEDGNGSGTGGNPADNMAPQSGAAYYFRNFIRFWGDTQYQGIELNGIADSPQLSALGFGWISSIQIPPGWKVTLYASPNYAGDSMVFWADVPNLSAIRGPCGGSWNDCAQSFTIVPPATVKFFEHTNYAGAVLIADAENPRLADSGWDNRISSIQVPLGWKVTLYTGQDYTGLEPRQFAADARDLPSTPGPTLCGGNWNDCANSFRLGPTPLWAITKTHSGNFVRGQQGEYVIKITNIGAKAALGNRSVQVEDALPQGLTAVSFGGDFWSCAPNRCNATETPLLAGKSYPDLTLGVRVAADAPASVTNVATVSGGGAVLPASASDPTTIIDCSYGLNPPSGQASFGAGGEAAIVLVFASGGCAWTAVSNAAWITVNSEVNGSGNGAVQYTVAANPNSTERAGTMTIAGKTFTVTQAGAACSYSLSPTSFSYGAGGGGTIVSVVAQGGCAWTSVSNAAWITIVGGALGSGNGTVSYNVAANPNSTQRTGTMTIAGKTFTVTQAGVACTYSISPTSASTSSNGGVGSVAVTAPGGCAWTAVSNAAWITVAGASASGSGNGTVSYTVAANGGANRMGTITVAEANFTVTQGGAGEPVVVGMSPASGTGSSGLFTFNFSDPDGFADLNILNVLISNAIDGRNACYIAFARSTGTLFLVNDAGQAGGPFAGSITIPGSGAVGNSQCSINATGSSVTGSGNTVSLTLNMSFTAGFGGRRIHYLAARDTVEHNSGWHAKGVWTVPFTQPATAVISMSPARAEGNVVTLTTVFSDVNGFADLNVLNILINDGIDGRNACYIAYVRPTRTLLLVNDAGAAGGPFAGTIAIPGTGIANNSQCAINATGSGIVESGNTVTLTLNLTLTGAFQGDRIVFAAARDVAENNSGWQAMATITVPPN